MRRETIKDTIERDIMAIMLLIIIIIIIIIIVIFISSTIIIIIIIIIVVVVVVIVIFIISILLLLLLLLLLLIIIIIILPHTPTQMEVIIHPLVNYLLLPSLRYLSRFSPVRVRRGRRYIHLWQVVQRSFPLLQRVHPS